MNIATGGIMVAILNQKDARKLDFHSGDRVLVKHGKKEATCILDLSESKKAVPEGEIGLFEEVLSRLNVRSRSLVHISYTGKPEAVKHIRDKLYGKTLTYKELYHIMDDLTHDRLTDIEKTYFVSAGFTNGWSHEEIVDMTKAMVNTGDKIKFNGVTLDKHCLSGDIPVIIKNSSKVKVRGIGEIIDGVFDENKSEIVLKDGAEYVAKNPKNIQVLTFGDDGIVKFAPVTGFFRVKSPQKLQEITLIGNRTIKITPDHTVFTLKKGRITNVPAAELKVGDFVVVPSGINNITTPLTEIKVEPMDNDRFKRVDSISITPEFMRLLGYYIAEGFTNEQGIFLNFGSHETDLIEDAKKCVQSVFGFKPTINIPHPTAIRVTIYSQQLAKLFREKINSGCSALEKKIPAFVFDLSRELQLDFLQALFNGDGYTRRGYEAIYVTSSKQLSTDLQYLLSLLGMSVSLSCSKAGIRKFPTGESKVEESYYIYTQAREIFGGRKQLNVSYLNLLPTKELGEIDASKIDDYELRRAFRRNNYITKEHLRKCSEALTCPDIKSIIFGNLSVLPIKINKEVESTTSYVYDFYVDGYNKFMAGTAPMAVHNCIGGIPGNRTTMIVIPIIASAGFTIPKTSSRAITSPAGTADTMECLAKVELSKQKIISIVHKIKACIVHGGSMNLAPADDKIIEVEHPLSIDAEGQLLASVMAKKYSVSANHILIDIPMGQKAKVKSLEEAKHFKEMFELIGKKLGMHVKVIVSDGSQPVGRGVGPLLEAEDVLAVLRNDPSAPEDLKNKSLSLAGMLLEMTGKYKPGKGTEKAKEILESGKAYHKMQEIIEAQGRQTKPKLGEHWSTVKTEKAGTVREIDNDIIAKVARIAGAPEDKGAGLYLHKKVNERVKKGELLYTLYAENKTKLELAQEFILKQKGYLIY